MTMPVTTPMPKESANTFSQKSNTRRYTALPVASRVPSRVASQAASPIVKAGKMMWKLTTKANWMRESSTGSRSISVSRCYGKVGPNYPSEFRDLAAGVTPKLWEMPDMVGVMEAWEALENGAPNLEGSWP